MLTSQLTHISMTSNTTIEARRKSPLRLGLTASIVSLSWGMSPGTLGFSSFLWPHPGWFTAQYWGSHCYQPWIWSPPVPELIRQQRRSHLQDMISTSAGLNTANCVALIYRNARKLVKISLISSLITCIPGPQPPDWVAFIDRGAGNFSGFVADPIAISRPHGCHLQKCGGTC